MRALSHLTFGAHCALNVAAAAAASAADVTATWNANASGGWNDATRWSSNPNFPHNGNAGVTYDVTKSSGTTTLNRDIQVERFTFSGGSLTSGGPFTLTLNDLFTWNGGPLEGNGAGAAVVRAAGGMALGGGAKTMTVGSNLTWTIINAGTATFSGGAPASLTMARSGNVSIAGARLINDGTFNAADEADMAMNGSGGPPAFTNNGAFNKTGASTTTTVAPRFDNTGTVHVLGGTLALSGSGGTSTGAFVVDAGAVLSFGRGSFVNGATSTFSGAGTVLFDGVATDAWSTAGAYVVTGTTEIRGSVANFNSASATTSRLLLSSFLGGTGRLTVTNLATWGIGTMRDAGETIIAPTAVIEINQAENKVIAAPRTLSNYGTANFSQGSLVMHPGAGEPGAVFANYGFFNATDGAAITLVGGLDIDDLPHFRNWPGGTYTKSGPGTTSQIFAMFHNDGRVEVASGTLRLQNGGSAAGGVFHVAAGATLQFFDKTFALDAASGIAGAGDVIFGSGGSNTTNIAGPYTITGKTTILRTANFSHAGGTTLRQLDLSGTMGGTGDVTLSGPVDWTAGGIAGVGTTTIMEGVTVIAHGTEPKSLGREQRKLVNNGTIELIDGNFEILYSHSHHPASSLVNNGELTVEGDVDFEVGARLQGDGTPSFTNDAAGVITRNGAGTESEVEMPFFNHGLIRVESGSLAFLSLIAPNFSQGGGELRLEGGNVRTNGVLEVTLGRVSGHGTITGNLDNFGGAVAPDGRLAITGDLRLGSGSVLEVDIGGTASGVDHDLITEAGTSALGRQGELHVRFANGFEGNIQPNDAFTILTSNQATTGQFSNVFNGRVMTVDGNGSFAVSAPGAAAIILSQYAPAPKPEIAAELPPGTPLIDDVSAADFGTNQVGAGTELVFSLRNDGTMTLTIGGITIDGPHAGDYALVEAPPATIAAGQSVPFRVRFTPAGGGLRTASLHLESNDLDEASFDIALGGMGNTPPSLVLPASPIIEEATSADGAVVNFTVGATDAEDTVAPVPILSRPSGWMFPLGDTTVTVSVTDSANEPSHGSFVVRVVDTTPPVITQTGPIPPATALPDGTMLVPAILAAFAASDVVGVTSFTQSPAAGTAVPTGTAIQLTATDAAGKSVSSDITLRVNTPPSLVLPASPVVAEATSAAGASVSFDVSATDAEDTPAPVPLAFPPSSSVFPLGETTVTVSVTDSANAPANGSFVVRVIDTTPPVITQTGPIPPATALPDGTMLVPALLASFAASDAVGATSFTQSPAAGTAVPTGTAIRLTATDAAGKSVSSDITLRVNTPPSLVLPASPLVAEATSPDGVVVSFNVSATDAEDSLAPLPVASPPSGSVFPLGDTKVTVRVTDSANAPGEGSFIVRVTDTAPPVITQTSPIPQPIALLDGTMLPPSLLAAFAASDAVGVTSFRQSPDARSAVPVNDLDVQLTAIDAAGNSATKSVTVPAIAERRDGELDLTWGGTGVVLNEMTSAEEVVVQPDEKILVAGTAGEHIALVRYNPDGTLDPAFGAGGYAVAPFAQTTGADVAVQANGKILVAGTETTAPTDIASIIIRFHADGSLDESFGSMGRTKVHSAFYARQHVPPSVAVQGDGKIIVAGTTRWVLGPDTPSPLIARLHSDGTLDSTFGGTGRVFLPLDSEANDVAVQTDGKIVLAGNSPPWISFWDNVGGGVVAMRIMPDGKPDDEFSAHNSSSQGFSAHGKALALLENGGIAVAGWVGPSGGEPKADAALFGPGEFSRFLPLWGKGTAESVTIEPDGRVLFAGSHISAEGIRSFGLLRTHSDGRQDETFGNGNAIVTSFAGGASAHDVTLQSDRKIIVVGDVISPGGSRAAVARYTNSIRPRLTSPRPVTSYGLQASPYGDSFPVAFRLEEDAQPGSLVLIFKGGEEYRVITLASALESAGPHDFILFPANPTTSSGVASGGAIPDGAYDIALGYRDTAGNSSISSPVRVLIDTVPPALTLPPDMFVWATSSDGALVFFEVSAMDSGWPITASATPSSRETFPVGTTVVQVTAKDWAGNEANGSFSVTVGPLPPILQVEIETAEGTILRETTEVVMWGDNSAGKSAVPPGLRDVKVLALGDYHTLALKGDGTVTGWGSDYIGQASPPPGLDQVRSLALGNDYSMALKHDGSLVLWGNPELQAKVQVWSGIDAIAGNNSYALALKLGVVIASTWYRPGWVSWPQMPWRLNEDQNVQAIAVGDSHSVALKSDGSVVSWSDFRGGNMSPGLTDVIQIAANKNYTLTLSRNGTVREWPAGEEPPEGLSNVLKIAAGDNHRVALTREGRVMTWGDSFAALNPPTGLTGVIDIAAGNGNTAAIVRSLPRIDFGSVITGFGVTQTMRLKNIGHELLTVQAIEISGQEGYIFNSEGTDSLLPPGEETSLMLSFSPSGTGMRTANLIVESNDPGRPRAELLLTGYGATQLLEWRQTWFGTTASSGEAADGADPNQNGLPNILEYALNGPPKGFQPRPPGLPEATLGSSGELALAFQRHPDRTDVTLTVECASSLGGPWIPVATSTGGQPYVADSPTAVVFEQEVGGVHNVRISDTQAMPGGPRQQSFMRFSAKAR